MQFRQAKKEEFLKVRDFYWDLIEKMKDQADLIGWKKGIYPDDEMLETCLDRGECYLLTDEEEIIGAVIVNSSTNEGYDGVAWKKSWKAGEVLVPHALAVTPKRQRQGLGKILMHHVRELAEKENKKAIHLDILAANEAAEKLYTSLGFEVTAVKNMYYPDTGWAVYKIMEWDF